MYKLYSLDEVFSDNIVSKLENIPVSLLTVEMSSYLPVLDKTYGSSLKNPVNLAYVEYVVYDHILDRWKEIDHPGIIFNVTNLMEQYTLLERDGYAIHELVHIKQMIEGRLIYRPHDKVYPVSFAGLSYPWEWVLRDNYYDRPWEVEAVMEQLRYTHPEDPEGQFVILKEEYDDWIKHNKK